MTNYEVKFRKQLEMKIEEQILSEYDRCCYISFRFFLIELRFVFLYNVISAGDGHLQSTLKPERNDNASRNARRLRRGRE